ncbi:MAG: serine hydrolase [Gemmatimonas sp.]|nr:serine hydrolase [Gemmatimonas sp.]
MRSIRRISMLALLLVAAAVQPIVGQGLVSGTPESAGMSSARIDRLTSALESYVSGGELAGAVTLVARGGTIVYLDAVGERDVEGEDPMEVDDIFRIASQSKAVVSVAAMILQEEGRLLLTDPVGDYLPEFRETSVAVQGEGGGYDVVPADRQITIRDLLTHTSGLSYGSGPAAEVWEAAGIQGWYFADRDETVGETVSRLAELPFDAHPGEAWIYGYSIDVLGAVVEQASGEPLDEFLASRIFQPLGMADTHFYLPASKRDRLVTVYSAGDEGLSRTADCCGMVSQGAYADGPKRSFSGGAGLVSTAGDYGTFLQMLLNGGELDGHRILSRKTVELMTTDHLGDLEFQAGQGFGLGFSIVEDLGERGIPGSVGEFGWGGAYHSTYWVDPEEELVVVYLTQLLPAGSIDDHARLRALIYQAIVD